MLRLVFGFVTENRDSDPVTLYAGHDADAAQRAIDAAPSCFLRVETAELLNLRRAKRSREPLAGPLAAPRPPLSEEEGLAMLDRIEQLEELLRCERASRDEERAGLQEEFKRQIAVGTDEITALRAQLAEAQARLSTTTPSSAAASEQSGESAGKVPGAESDSGSGASDGVAPSSAATETPAAATASAGTAAVSGDGPQLGAPEAPPKRRGK